MSRHLALRSGNPALTTNTFKGKPLKDYNHSMTIEGTVNKIGLCLMLTGISAYYTYSQNILNLIFVGFIGGFIIALITIFKKEWSPYTVPIYAVLEGLALGGISAIYEHQYTGIAQQAIFLTFGILGTLLFAYKSKIIKPTENFKLGLFAATGGIFLIYFINFIMSFFGGGIPVIHSNGTFGVLFSFGVVIIASLNLVLDFDFIEEGAELGAPKYMEWYSAFGLLITLIWLYLEILRLLAKLRSRRH